jgi:endogenous inhibitor of DNA gyrase (YacG/DUF329 family)
MSAQRADRDAGAHAPTGGRGKCPICGRPGVDRYKPFCSRRCADIDLSRWLSGAYAIPDRTDSEDGGEEAAGNQSDPADLARKE